jgi:uncharacterized FAD-dependent dehydrogenase
VTWTDLGTALPDYAIAAIREAIPVFDKTLKGFAMDDAVLTAVETRTSSPIRITRGEYLKARIPGLISRRRARALPAASSPPPWTG